VRRGEAARRAVVRIEPDGKAALPCSRARRGSFVSIGFAFGVSPRNSWGVQLNFRRFDLQLIHAWRISSGVGGSGATFYPIALLELKDEAGRHGVGEAAPSDRYHEDVDTVQAFLSRVEANRLSFDDVDASMAYLDRVAPGNFAAKCALNIALLDGAARAARQPIYDFLQLGFIENKHVTSFSIGIDTPDVIREKVRQAENYPALKLKVGGPDDEANFAALRSVAPKKPVSVDANEAWTTKEEALRHIEWLHRDGHVKVIEQPMPATCNPRDLAWLKERSPLPIFGDESYHHASDVQLAADCFHGVNVKLVKAGGISGAYEALQAARKAGLQTMIGCMIESSILITAAAHLAELTHHLDLDGNLLISNDPYRGATAENGIISFAQIPEQFGLRVSPR
jgi:L-alanine-DL-glutamate epimerase-like enolase superfamily enzyme